MEYSELANISYLTAPQSLATYPGGGRLHHPALFEQPCNEVGFSSSHGVDYAAASAVQLSRSSSNAVPGFYVGEESTGCLEEGYLAAATYYQGGFVPSQHPEHLQLEGCLIPSCKFVQQHLPNHHAVFPHNIGGGCSFQNYPAFQAGFLDNHSVSLVGSYKQIAFSICEEMQLEELIMLKEVRGWNIVPIPSLLQWQ